MNEWMNGQMNGEMNGEMNVWIKKRKKLLINESINELLENVNFNETNRDGKMEKEKELVLE